MKEQASHILFKIKFQAYQGLSRPNFHTSKHPTWVKVNYCLNTENWGFTDTQISRRECVNTFKSSIMSIFKNFQGLDSLQSNYKCEKKKSCKIYLKEKFTHKWKFSRQLWNWIQLSLVNR